MRRVLEVIEYVDVVLFIGLAWVTFRRWREHRDPAGRWAFLMFLSLASVVTASLFFPDDSDYGLTEYLQTLFVAVLLLFPYFLYRLARSFSERAHSVPDHLANVLTAGVVIWAVVLPRLPDEGEPRSPGYQAFIFAVLIQWVLLSAIVAADFWRSGRGQPDVARARMRSLSLASVMLSVAIVVSGTSSETRPVGVDFLIQGLVFLSVVFFFVSFSPPSWLRMQWRAGAESQLREAAIELMSAGDREEVVGTLLPQAANLVGGQGIVVLDQDKKVLGSYGFTAEESAEALQASGDRRDLIALEFPFGSLIVRTSAHTPFFGADDITLLGSLGALTNLALKRIEAVAIERQLGEAKLRRRQALEINDNIVQGLAVAHYAFELGQTEKGLESIKRTLDAARRIIGDLVRELPSEDQFGAQTLTRGTPAMAEHVGPTSEVRPNPIP